MKSDSPLAQVLARLEGVEEYNGGFRARCPAHDDHDPSLQIREVEENGSRRVLLHCFVCKDQEKVLQALEKRGIAKADLFNNPSKTPNKGGAKKPKRRMCLTKAYDYRTPNGKFIRHCTLRFTPPPEGAEHHPDCRGQHIDSSRKDKDFRQARPNETGSYAYDLNGVQPILYNLTDVMQAALQGETVVWVE